MEGSENLCWFDHISDDIILRILSYVPRKYWCNLNDVSLRFRSICNDRTLFRRSHFESSYGMTDGSLTNYLRSGANFIEVLSLNFCHWFTSSLLSTSISRCKKIQELYLLDCRLTAKGLSRILCSLTCLRTLVVSISNLLDFSNEINCNPAVQASLQNLRHFGLHIRDLNSASSTASVQFHLSQQTTIIEYCPQLETFCVIGQPGSCQRLSKQLIHPLIVKRENMKNLKTMSINSTNDATARLYFFGILIVAFEVGIHFKNLSVSGLDLKQAVKKSYFIRSLKESCPSLNNLDLSRVHIDDLEASVSIEDAPLLRYLNLSDVRSESTCVGLMKIANYCPNLVSLNLRGATSGHKYWKQEELYNFKQVLQVCRHLRHINLSGIHIHEPEIQLSLTKLLAQHASKGLESLALSVCCLLKRETKEQTRSIAYPTGFGKKKMRLAHQPGPSTSSDLDAGQYSYSSGLFDLSSACPNITSLELINAGFVQSVVHSSHKPVFSPCKESYNLTEKHLLPVTTWTNLRSLQLIGMPGINVEKALTEIAQNCVHLRSLSVAYLGLSSWVPTAWPPCLEDLRVEQPYMVFDERFFQTCLTCWDLQRLCLVSKHSRLVPKAFETYVQQARNLFMLQVYTDTTLKVCEKLQSTLQKRYEGERPGFIAVFHQLQHDKLPYIIADLPLKHLEEMTILTSRICSKPPDSFI